MSEAHGRGPVAAARLQAATDELLAEAQRLPQELLTWQPAPDVWSVMDILCHVEEFVPYWTHQAMAAMQHPEVAWGRDHTNKDRLAAVTGTASRVLADVTRNIRAAAIQSAETLRGMSDASFDIEAPSRNPRFGVKPASFIVDHLLVQHVEKHIGQIRRNVSQYQERGSSAS